MRSSKHFAADAVASVMVLFGGVWVYEISNWASLTIQGHPATIGVSGWVPLGVVTISAIPPSPLTKVLQVLVAVALLLPVGVLLARAKLSFAEITTVSTLGVFAASFYWELLSSLNTVPMVAHETIFIATVAALVAPFLRSLGKAPTGPLGPRAEPIVNPRPRAV